MPEPNKPIASARAKLFAVPPNGDPVLLGIVEDFSISEQFAAENLPSVGEFVPVDSVINSTQGRLRWGRVAKTAANILNIIRPRVAEFASYQSFDVLAVDSVDNRPLVRALNVLPDSLDWNVTNGRAWREGYTAICRYTQFGDEILEAAA